MVIHGDPSTNINEVEKVEIVFKDGIGYDSAKLINSVRGQVASRFTGPLSFGVPGTLIGIVRNPHFGRAPAEGLDSSKFTPNYSPLS